MRVYIVIAVAIELTGRANSKPQLTEITSASDQNNNRPTCGSAAAVTHVASSTSFVRDDASPLNDNGGLASLHNSKTNLGIDTYRCAASLISDQFLITAAHCMAERHGLIGIVLGRGNLTDRALPRNTYEIAEKFIHPNYNSSVTEYSDIAILRTNRKVIFSDKIWPYCLPEKNQVFGDYLVVRISGWGQVDQFWNTSPVVKTAFVKIVENKRCEALWLQRAPGIYEKDLKKFSYPQGITNLLLCAGREDVGSCKGDSGGPISFQTSDGLNRVIGVISKGLRTCPKEIILPSFYVNIAVFIDWIKEKTGQSKFVSITDESTSTSHSTDCAGSCIPIKECPSLSFTLEEAQTGKFEAIQRLRDLVCSSANGSLGVCCQEQDEPICGFYNEENCKHESIKSLCPNTCKPSKACGSHSPCGAGSFCGSGNCVACKSAGCGIGSNCRVNQTGKLICSCPKNTQGDPLTQCFPVTGCDEHSQCAENKRCESGRCVNPCELIQCGKGAKCQVHERNPYCICPPNTQGNPSKQCEPVPDARVVFPSDNPTQTQATNVSGQVAGNVRQPGCTIRPDLRECRGTFPRFYYNADLDQCDCFLFGGCDEEGVQFTWLTLRNCVNACVPTNLNRGPGCQRATLDEVQAFLDSQRKPADISLDEIRRN